MPSPFNMSGSSTTLGERSSSAEKGWTARDRPENGRSPHVNSGLDSQLWHACAGAMVHLPQVGAKVIYFPQGHAEHASSPPEFPRSIAVAPTVLCRVLSVSFLADTETDEVYTRIRLQPDPGAISDPFDDPPASPPLPEKTASFAKTLTQSDANNGGGFSVPRYCAETIFPRLDYTEDPPVQIVIAKDVHGVMWRFRHIYRGTPRRHLLTTGWSSFVNQKKLVAGDAIVFLRSASGELCVGVRRSTRGGGGGGGDVSSWQNPNTPNAPSSQASRWEFKPAESSYDFLGAGMHSTRTGSDMGGTSNFARNRSRVTAKAVLEAASLAAAGHPFEVVYYPRATISEFCVKASAVKASLQLNWAPGMRFKMAVETEDASRISWFMGTISKVQETDSMRWPNSPWKMLQVTWDEPDLLQGIARVNPWQVELVSPMQLPPFSLPKKKMRLLQPPEIQRDGLGGTLGFSSMSSSLASNLLGHINPWHGFADNVSAGMQGARQDRSFGLTIPDFRPGYSQPHIVWDSLYGHQERPKVLTDLNMGSLVNKGHLSSGPRNISALLSVGSSSSESGLNNGGDKDVNSTPKSAPFLLFGKAIDTSQSFKSQPPSQLSLMGRSSSDDQGQDTFPNAIRLEAWGRPQFWAPGHFERPGASSLPSLQEGVLDSAADQVGTLDLFKEQAASFVERGRCTSSLENSFDSHCKVFKESDEVGRTLDLSSCESYEELHEKLSSMFGVEKADILGRVVYSDLMGFNRPIGEEPYREFTKRVKRLKILSESSSESITR